MNARCPAKSHSCISGSQSCEWMSGRTIPVSCFLIPGLDGGKQPVGVWCSYYRSTNGRAGLDECNDAFRLLLHGPPMVSPSVKCSLVPFLHLFHFFFPSPAFPPSPPPVLGLNPRINHPPPLGSHACEASIYHCVLPLGLVLRHIVQASEVLVCFFTSLALGSQGLLNTTPGFIWC